MYELVEYGNDEILKWLKEHGDYATKLRGEAKVQDCRNLAIGIIECAERMTTALSQYEQPELRRKAMLMEQIREWKESHPGEEPSQDVLSSLDTDVAKRTFSDAYPEI